MSERVQFYDSPEAEARAIRRAVARVPSCRVETLATIDQRTRRAHASARVAGVVMCVDGWGAAWLLLALAEEDAQTRGARALAAKLRAMAPSDDDYARALHAFVRSRVSFVREVGEIFQSGAFTLNEGYGDCDDHFRLLYALAVAGGLSARLGILHHGVHAVPELQGPAHATAMLCLRGQCQWAETTVDARFAENPNVAARRLGLTSERSDIAQEVVIMSSDELPPIPLRFREHNNAAQVALDAQALQRLGFLCAELEPPTDPTDETLRRAVLAFQVAKGLNADGLLGDQETRPAIVKALREAGITDFDYTLHIGGIGDVKPLFTHAQAREALRAAYVAEFGREPSKGELDFGLATAYFETFYGRGGAAGWANRGQFGRWSAEGKFNWGALESGNASGNPAFVARLKAAGLSFVLERGSDGGNATFFYLFPNDEQAARAFLMVWGAKDTLAAAASESANAVALAMRNHGYYTGFHVGPGKLTPQLQEANRRMGRKAWQEESSDAEALRLNVAEYAAGLARSVRTVTGAGGVDNPSGSGAGGISAAGVALVGVGVLLAAGLAYWRFYA